MSHPVEPLIQAQALGLGYGPKTVLENVDLTVAAGDFWFLLGQNGTGKSTLLKALLGLLRPQRGGIRLHPRLVDRCTVGFVPQQPEINPTLPTTVREFVRLGLVGLPGTRKAERQRLGWALDHVGLSGMEQEDYWSLSGGQRQRVLVARALARRPELLLMDEPTAGLDPAAESTLLRYLASLHQDAGLTLVCVSHAPAIAARHASHVALFHERTVWAGRAADVLTHENLIRVYGMTVALAS